MYWAHMVAKNKGLEFKELKKACKAPLLHLWNIHSHCQSSWCAEKAKEEQEQQENKKEEQPLPSSSTTDATPFPCSTVESEEEISSSNSPVQPCKKAPTPSLAGDVPIAAAVPSPTTKAVVASPLVSTSHN